MKKYDIFISYRREGAGDTAKHIKDTLSEKGYRVFFDMESMNSGQFNTQLYDIIASAKDFLLILPAGGLDRCMREDDWVRLEIEHAFRTQKNIVPIFLEGFVFPEQLPESLEFLRMQQGLSASVEYYDVFIQRLQKYLRSKHRMAKSTKIILSFCSLALVFSAVFMLFEYYAENPFGAFPHGYREEQLLKTVISDLTLELEQYDKVYSIYNSNLDEMSDFVNDKSLLTAQELYDSLENSLSEIAKCYDSCETYYGMVSAIKEPVEESPLDYESFESLMGSIIYEIKVDYQDTDYIRNEVYSYDRRFNKATLSEEEIIAKKRETKRLNTIIDVSKAYEKTEAELAFYLMNRILLPVTEPKRLSELKNRQLPSYSFVYAEHLEMTDDKQKVDTRITELMNQIETYKSQLQKWLDD